MIIKISILITLEKKDIFLQIQGMGNSGMVTRTYSGGGVTVQPSVRNKIKYKGLNIDLMLMS